MSRNTLEAMVSKFLSYSYPETVFAWQGGEPTLAGPEFFEDACRLQLRRGSNGQ